MDYSNDDPAQLRMFAQVRNGFEGGAACRSRTDDLFITSESLYRLS
jgi:hypothetical protein